jgi:hypothetical protein
MNTKKNCKPKKQFGKTNKKQSSQSKNTKKKISKTNKKMRFSKLNDKKKQGGAGTVIIEENDDGFGFRISNLLSNDFIDTSLSTVFGPRRCGCDPENEYIENFMKITKLKQISNGPSNSPSVFNFATIGSDNQECEVYCMSNYLNTETLNVFKSGLVGLHEYWIRPGEPIGNLKTIKDTLTKYIQWIFYHIASTIYISYELDKDRHKRIKIRFLFDKTNWDILNSIETTNLDDSPFILLARDILLNDCPVYPRNKKINLDTIKYMKYALGLFINECTSNNYSIGEQYMLLLFYAANSLNLDVPDKLEVFFYEFPSLQVQIPLQKPLPNGITHITTNSNSESIGQIVRFISLMQTAYRYERAVIIPPKIVHFRDGHACCTSYNSFIFENSWLLSNYRYLSGQSLHYTREWHEFRKGSFAGFFSAKRDPDDTSIMPIEQWKNTFGRAFCAQRDSQKVMKVCPHRQHNAVQQYGYGIDEFTMSYIYLDENKKSGWEPDSQPYIQEIYKNTLYVPTTWLSVIGSTGIVDFIIKKEYYTKGKSQREVDIIKSMIDLQVSKRYQALNINARPIGETADPNIMTPRIQIFYYQFASLTCLIYNCFYLFYKRANDNRSPTWLELIYYMYTWKDAVARGVNPFDNQTPLDDQTLSFALLVPPVYSTFNTLFNNSDNLYNFENTTFVPYADDATVITNIQEFFKNASLYGKPEATLIKNYCKIYSIYDILSETEPWYGWDLRQWYDDNEDIHVTISPDRKSLVFTDIDI